MINVFEDHSGYVAVHHGWEQTVVGSTAHTAVARLHALLVSHRDAGAARFLTTSDGMPATDADIDLALVEIREYAQAKGVDLAVLDEPEAHGPADGRVRNHRFRRIGSLPGR
ncbi:hypothetical protein [Streptomyces sp. NPDC088785]|uniref:hypothetical protein n=1 Tax=Streptomyces sp. NPDC088785 TaxID=3365897 RepID=UPI003828B88E